MTYASPPFTRYLITGVKVGVSAVLIWLIATQLDLSVFVNHWRELSPAAVAAFLALIALQTIFISGMRLKMVLECFGQHQPLQRTAQVAWCGFFFEQIALGIVGGDAMRLWLLHRIGIPLRDAFKALVVDRCLGLGALLMLVAIGLPILLRDFPAFRDRLSIPMIWAAMAVAVAVGLAVLYLIPEKYRRHPVFSELRAMFSVSLRDRYVRMRLLLTFCYAVCTHVLSILIFFLIARDLGLQITLAQWFCLAPAALVFSMIPVSAGGWGLREGIFIFGLGTLGVQPEEAAVVSILFGLGVLAVTLPGGLVWLSNRKP
jgi:uncharacterized protein (TIRG00374 family)